jgi:hypothetical protein
MSHSPRHRRSWRASRAVRLAVVAVVALLVLAAVAGVATGQSASDDRAGDAEERLRAAVDAYAAGDATLDVPGRDQVVGPLNVEVRDDRRDATYEFSMVVTDDYRIDDFAAGPRDDARRKAVTDYATLVAVSEADDPARAFERAVRDGDVRIVGEDGHPIEQLKWMLLNLLRSILA